MKYYEIENNATLYKIRVVPIKSQVPPFIQKNSGASKLISCLKNNNGQLLLKFILYYFAKVISLKHLKTDMHNNVCHLSNKT